MKNVYTETAGKVLGQAKKKKQAMAKGARNTTKNTAVKRRAREDKLRVRLEQMGDEVEKYAENGRTRELYQTAKNHKQSVASSCSS